MLFSSLDFAIFLPIVFVCYWFLFGKNLKFQNLFLLIASLVFYGWWNWKYLSLLIFSTIVDYSVCSLLVDEKRKSVRKALLLVSICVNLGFLGFFKYQHFFIQSFNDAFSFFGQPIGLRALSFLLPVGISFYTFQTMSYTIDVYKNRLTASKNFIQFAAFVSFFPQLVAGPIERATNLLAQIQKERKFDSTLAVIGLKQILWGFFKKLVVADNCAIGANMIFDNYENYSGSTLLIGAILFSFQIYGDFSGYSDIAIGISRLFGFNLMKNFAFPYFSRDIAEFWRRWHISLSTWFRDYVYFPLGGSQFGFWKTLRNTFAIFLISGFWHGANWTFVAWGGLHALFFLPLLIQKKNRKNLEIVAHNTVLPSLMDFLNMVLTFGLVMIGWIFFRSPTVSDAFQFVLKLMSASLFDPIHPRVSNSIDLSFIFIAVCLVVEWLGRRSEFALQHTLSAFPRLVSWSFYSVLVFIIFVFMQTNETPFIYFQF